MLGAISQQVSFSILHCHFCRWFRVLGTALVAIAVIQLELLAGSELFCMVVLQIIRGYQCTLCGCSLWLHKWDPRSRVSSRQFACHFCRRIRGSKERHSIRLAICINGQGHNFTNWPPDIICCLCMETQCRLPTEELGC